ncbi:hypothetical protein FVE85_0962 [Porphyridium purpureum]|uniref:DUF427 domain-containing protein n=1 Tax=Porphyridium purpureum TaxID=35688 RepID=A0A5J4Z2T6_PORPP|nr:hypothetical protein FVE85_0962 [Porphyridium purpureum]|eukprot:POR2230..scf208_2
MTTFMKNLLGSKKGSNASLLEDLAGSGTTTPKRSSGAGSGLGSRAGSLFARSSTRQVKPPMEATWNGQVVASGSDYEVLDGTFYFARSALFEEFFSPGDFSKDDPKKGKASYMNITVDGKVHSNAAFYFAEPTPYAAKIKDMVAFWKGVPVTPAGEKDEQDLGDVEL